MQTSNVKYIRMLMKMVDPSGALMLANYASWVF